VLKERQASVFKKMLSISVLGKRLVGAEDLWLEDSLLVTGLENGFFFVPVRKIVLFRTMR